MIKEELEKEVEDYLHKNYCCKGSYCGFNTECKEGVRIRCSEFEILEKHIINFAEPREKRITELERKIASIRGCNRVNLTKLNARTEQVERLKRENAELKNKLRFMGEQIDNLKAIVRYDKLTKAKDFLKTMTALIETFNSSNGSLDKLIIDVKQFLSEVEK